LEAFLLLLEFFNELSESKGGNHGDRVELDGNAAGLEKKRLGE
jgi:hypothetical protein